MVYLSIQHKQDRKQGDGTEKAALAVMHIATAATKRERMIMVMDMGWTHFIQQFLPPHPLHAFNSMENVSMYLNHLKLLTQIIIVRFCTNAEQRHILIFALRLTGLQFFNHLKSLIQIIIVRFCTYAQQRHKLVFAQTYWFTILHSLTL
jgi:hypothetical protein